MSSSIPPPPRPGLSYGPGGPPTTDGQAVAALVCGIVGVLCIVPAVVAIVLGFMSRARIERSNGQLRGEGMALAGIVLGILWVVLAIVFISVRVSSD